MLNDLLNKFRKKKSPPNSELAPSAEEARASVLSRKMQENVNALKPKIETTVAIVDRNRWALAAIIMALIVLISVMGWYKADERFANHVRVAFVKLDPSGSTSVSFYDENSKPSYFINTIYSKLTEYVERRYSKISYSISADYGFALNFMSPQLKNAFLNDYKAAKVAADFANCKACQQIRVQVRTIQNDESDQAILDGRPGTIFRSTVFARVTELNPDGTVVSRANQIITLTWTIMNMAALPNNLDAIAANPIGIEILAEDIKADPTPITD